MIGMKMKYFVLKPEGNNPYAKASRGAMHRYATLIETENPALADDLRDWITDETGEVGEAVLPAVAGDPPDRHKGGS